jgi:hypothetical protein
LEPFCAKGGVVPLERSHFQPFLWMVEDDNFNIDVDLTLCHPIFHCLNTLCYRIEEEKEFAALGDFQDAEMEAPEDEKKGELINTDPKKDKKDEEEKLGDKLNECNL